MNKLLMLGLLVLSGLFVVPTMAQDVYQQRGLHNRHERQERRERQDGYNRERRIRRIYETRNNDYNYNNVYAVNEYRYVRVGSRVYKETYRSTYTRNGMLVNRILVNRERMSQYDNYRGNNGLRFNIFLRF